MLRPNSRSCRTASIRSGIAGGLAGELKPAAQWRMAAVAADLFFVAAPRQIAYSHRRPTQLTHRPRKPAAGTCAASTLQDFKAVEHAW